MCILGTPAKEGGARSRWSYGRKTLAFASIGVDAGFVICLGARVDFLEFFDFLLGFARIDFMEDDELKEESSEQAEHLEKSLVP